MPQLHYYQLTEAKVYMALLYSTKGCEIIWIWVVVKEYPVGILVALNGGMEWPA